MSKKPKILGHSAHTQDAAARGLPGNILRPIKITMMGAGSGFTPRLMNDVLRIPGDQGGTIALVDIDRERLATKLIMQVHDELVFEVPEDELAHLKQQLPTLMTGVAQLKVPLVVDVGVGENWDRAH